MAFNCFDKWFCKPNSRILPCPWKRYLHGMKSNTKYVGVGGELDNIGLPQKTRWYVFSPFFYAYGHIVILGKK